MGGPTLDVTAVTGFLTGSVMTGVAAVAGAALIIYFSIKGYQYIRRAG